MDSTYDGGTVAGVDTASCPVNKFSYHPGQADQQANSEAIKCTLRKERSPDRKLYMKTVVVASVVW